MNSKIIAIMAIAMVSFLSQNVSAELYNSRGGAKASQRVQSQPTQKNTKIIASHIKSMAHLCIKNWEHENCLKELSALSMDLTVNYAEKLDAMQKQSQMENLKQGCAASTAALKISVPAYAMKSAITECVNIISDISDLSSIKPDVNLYQLLVGSVLCLSNDLACDNIETQLRSSVGR